MNGPHDPGTHENPLSPSDWTWEKHRLIRGRPYRVAKSFIDADEDQHQIVEEWVFVSSMFSRYDGELTLCVRPQSGSEWIIPLRENLDAQLEVIENFLQYVDLVAP